MKSLIILSLIGVAMNISGIVWEARRDYNLSKTVGPKHGLDALIRCLAWLFISGSIFFGSWESILFFWLLLGSQWFLSFDYLYNFFANLPWYSLGHTAKMDKIWSRPEDADKRLLVKIGIAVLFHTMHVIHFYANYNND